MRQYEPTPTKKVQLNLSLDAEVSDVARRLAAAQKYPSLSAYFTALVRHDQRQYNNGAT